MASELLGASGPALSATRVSVPMNGYPDLVEHYGGYAMTLFDGNPDDRELWKVVEFLRG